MNTFTNLG